MEIRVSAAVLNLLCSCIIAFMGDNVAKQTRSDSIFVLALCFLGITWSGPLTLLTGTQIYPGEFRIWQPLEGGVVFVLLQAFGWILYSSASLLCWIVLANYHTLQVRLCIRPSARPIGVVGCILLCLPCDPIHPYARHSDGAAAVTHT